MKNNKGFSLVELIVVIAIMAILAAVAVVSYSVYIDRAHEANDRQYEANLDRIAHLVATENQIDLDRAEAAGVVDGPEDIKLWVIDPETGEAVPVLFGDEEHYDKAIQEIYDAVGPWVSHNAIKDCDHSNCGVVEQQASTCAKEGWIEYTCGNREVLSGTNSDYHDDKHDTREQILQYFEYVSTVNGVDIFVCKECGTFTIEDSDHLVNPDNVQN